MQVSTRGYYGLLALIELAESGSKHPLPLREIARRRSISEAYLEQLFALLRKGGLVRSVRGAQGGYFLARPAEELTMAEILRLLDGPLGPRACVDPEVLEKDCCGQSPCLFRPIWEAVERAVADELGKHSLADLVRQQKLLIHADRPMFYI